MYVAISSFVNALCAMKYDVIYGFLSKFIELLLHSLLGFFFLLLSVVQDYCGAILEQGQIQKPPEPPCVFLLKLMNHTHMKLQ